MRSSAPAQKTGPPTPQSGTPGNATAAEPSATAGPRSDVSFGKFEILAAYTYARALRNGYSDTGAKQRGIVAAVMAAHARGVRGGGEKASVDSKALKKSKPMPTAATYDKQIATKMQPFYDAVFLPTMKQLVAARLTYDQVKELLKIPPAVGAKITERQFAERTAAFGQASKTSPLP